MQDSSKPQRVGIEVTTLAHSYITNTENQLAVFSCVKFKIYVIRFDKARLPYTSNSLTSINAIDLKFSHNFVIYSLNRR